MRTTALLLVLCATLAPRLAAQNTSVPADGLTIDSIGATDRSQNAAILRLLERSDVGERLRIAQALALRTDPYVGDILEYLRSADHGEARSAVELVVRAFIEEMFLAASGADAAERDRVTLAIAANHRALGLLVGSLQSASDPLLRRDLIRLADPLLDDSAAKSLAEEGRFLIGLMRASGGALAPDRVQEAVAFLAAGARFKDAVLREQAITIGALSTDRDVVTAARAALVR